MDMDPMLFGGLIALLLLLVMGILILLYLMLRRPADTAVLLPPLFGLKPVGLPPLYKGSTVYEVDTGIPIRVITNKERMRRYFEGGGDGPPLVITEQDRINARTAQDLIVEWCVMQTLQESHVAPFLASLKDACMQETNPVTACGLFAHLPEQYAKIAQKKHTAF